MKLGFTFDENILKEYTLNQFLNQLPYQAHHYEIAPDLDVLNLKAYTDIVKSVENHHYHVPYFVEPFKYDFSNDHYKNHFEKLFIIIDSLRQYSIKKPTIVIHGATIIKANQSAYNHTLRGIEYLLNFITNKSIDVSLSLETLSNRSGMIGSRENILSVLDQFKTDSLRICLDLCHDYFNFEDYSYPDQFFLDQVNYVHLHGMKNQKHISINHFPLEVIKGLNLDVDHTLELLTFNLKENYLISLKNDLQTLK